MNQLESSSSERSSPQRRGDVGRLGEKVLVARLLGELQRRGRVLEPGVRGVDAPHVVTRGGEARHELARGVGVVPEAGLGALGLELGDLAAPLVNVQVSLDLGEARRERLEVGTHDLRHLSVPAVTVS